MRAVVVRHDAARVRHERLEGEVVRDGGARDGSNGGDEEVAHLGLWSGKRGGRGACREGRELADTRAGHATTKKEESTTRDAESAPPSNAPRRGRQEGGEMQMTQLEKPPFKVVPFKFLRVTEVGPNLP